MSISGRERFGSVLLPFWATAALLVPATGCINIRIPKITLPHYGAYEIESDPPDAHVFTEQGTYMGRTPTVIVNRLGDRGTARYTIRVVKRGYREESHTYVASCDRLSADDARNHPRKVLVMLEPLPTPEGLGLDPLPADERRTLAVIDFSVGEGVPDDAGEAAADLCRGALAETRRFKLMDRNNVRAILGEQDFAAAIHCDSTECLAEYGRMLQAQQIVHGRIVRLGDAYSLSVGMTDVYTSELLGQTTMMVPERLEELKSIVPGEVWQMVADAER